MSFTANTRLPTRPLSYEYKDIAYNKELMVDYTTGEIYIKGTDGTIYNITEKVSEAVQKYIKDHPEVITQAIEIVIPGGQIVKLEDAIINIYTELNGDGTQANPGIKSRLSSVETKATQAAADAAEAKTNAATALAKANSVEATATEAKTIATEAKTIATQASSDVSTVKSDVTSLKKKTTAIGTIIEINETAGTAKLPASNITEDTSHKFVTSEQLTKIGLIDSKAQAKNYKNISVSYSGWSKVGDYDVYKKTVSVSGLKSTDMVIMDLITSSDLDTAAHEQEAYGIFKATTSDGSVTLYNNVNPADVSGGTDLLLQFIAIS